MVRVSSSAKLRPWSELTAKMVMGVVPGLVSVSTQEKEGISFKTSAQKIGQVMPSFFQWSNRFQ